MRVSGYQNCASFSLLCASVRHWQQREDSARGCCMVHRDCTGFGPNGERFPSVQQHVAPAWSVSLELEDHRWQQWEHKAALSQELVQLHQMPLQSESKHSETPLFFTHFSWSTGEFWVTAAEKTTNPLSVYLRTLCVCSPVFYRTRKPARGLGTHSCQGTEGSGEYR